MKVALLGFDVEGRASYDFLRAAGHEITICDRNPDLHVPSGVAAQLGPDYLDDLDRFELLVRTPGLHPAQILDKNPRVAGKITSATNLFFENSPSRHIIGVTGTKGKGTTSSLIARILAAAGKKVHLGGNIGVPALSFVHNVRPDDCVVLELSNFQCIDIKYSPAIGVCLMIVPEHLNWHKDFDEYVAAKRNLFARQTPDDLMVFNADNDVSRGIAHASPARKLWYSTAIDHLDRAVADPMHRGAYVSDGHIYMHDTEICRTNEVGLLGEHNWQNVCAAVAGAWEVIGGTKDAATARDAVREVVTTFRGLPFRIELRATKNGVRYYNDSFSTNPGSAMAAIAAVPGPKVMLMGGFDRGLDLSELCTVIKNTGDAIRKVVVYGASGVRLASELQKAGAANFIRTDSKDFKEIVTLASQQAQSGDAVVLSPAFASFDMFKNFEQRGIKYNEAVEAL